MRILFLATDAYGANGGIAKFNRDLIRAICAHPEVTQLTVIARLPSGVAHKDPSKKIKYLEPPGKISYVFCSVREAFFGGKWDILICGHTHFLILAWVITLFKKIRACLIIYGIESWKKPKIFLSQWLSKLNSVLSISEFSKQKFADWSGFDRRFHLLPCCVDLDKIHPMSPRYDLVLKYGLKDRKVIMTLARLAREEKYKGIDEVIQAMPEILKRVPDLVYLVCGTGNDQARLEKSVEVLGLKPYVLFTGFLPENDKLDYFRLADAFVMPGSGEGFGIVYLEAMACGVPVVGGKRDGSREALRDGKLGILVDPSDQEELVKGILEALNRPKGVIPEGLSHFSYEAFEKRTHAILDKI